MRSRTLGLLGASIVIGSGLWLACGGSDGANDPLTATDTEAGTVVPEGGTTADTGTSANDAGTGTDTGTVQQEAGGGDGGVNPPDAGPGGTTTILNCGATTCAIPAQACCVDLLGGGMTAFSCATTCAGLDAGAGGNNNDTAALKCSGQANCAAGTVCCVRQVGNNAAASECKATCGGNEAQLCDVAAVPTGCAAGQGNACSNNNIGDWALPQSFATCGGMGN